MKSFFSSKIPVALLSFFFGGLSTYFVSDYLNMKQQISSKSLTLSKETPKKLSLDPFERMRQISQRVDHVFGDSFFGQNHLDTLGYDSFSITSSEDDKFKYIKINTQGMNKDSLQVDVENGIIKISGEKVEDESTNNNSLVSKRHLVSKFLQSFSIPNGVQANDVKFERNEESIRLIFPKII